MPNHDEIMPRQVEREWFAAYAILACVLCAWVATWAGWWIIAPLIGLLIWQAVRVVRVMRTVE